MQLFAAANLITFRHAHMRQTWRDMWEAQSCLCSVGPRGGGQWSRHTVVVLETWLPEDLSSVFPGHSMVFARLSDKMLAVFARAAVSLRFGAVYLCVFLVRNNHLWFHGIRTECRGWGPVRDNNTDKISCECTWWFTAVVCPHVRYLFVKTRH